MARRALGLNGLTASFGSSFFERALADAAGRLAGLDLVGMLRANTLGLRPEAVHRGLTLEQVEELLVNAGLAGKTPLPK